MPTVVFTNPWTDPATLRSYRTGEVVELTEAQSFQLSRFGYVRTTDQLVTQPPKPYVLRPELDQYARWDTVRNASDQWYVMASRAGLIPAVTVPVSLTGDGVPVRTATPLGFVQATMLTAPAGGPVTVRGMVGTTPVGDITIPRGETSARAQWPYILPAGQTFHLGIIETPAKNAGADLTVVVGGAAVQA
jgi:hypothetical protein